MPDAITLDKANPLLPAEDFEALRKQGFKLIEKLGHDIWTEYNNSDPGITILDAVCYAITDLAYRTGFEIKDLLAPANLTDQTWNDIFYTARKILHNAPLTISDYRKMMIDVRGIRNAWIEPSKEYEVPLWVNYNSFRIDDHDDCACTDHHDFKGCLGNLQLQPANVDDLKIKWNKRKTEIPGEVNKAQLDIATTKDEIEKISKKEDPSEADKKKLVLLKKQLKEQNKKLFLLQLELKTISKEPLPSKITELEGLYNVMLEFEEDVPKDQYDEVRQKVIDRLSANRNLCEDYITINAVEYEDMGIGASIVLEEYADADIVLSEVFFRIYRYFTPSVPFHTIQQMLDKGYLVDEIFEGPPLKHGFIDTAELEKTDLYRDIRLSDIINDIADIPGIKAIKYLHLPFSNFDGEGELYFTKWVQYLREEKRIARIRPELSQVLLCKERDFITYYTGTSKDKNPARMVKLFNDLKARERAYKLEDPQLDFPVPAGEYMELEDYYPVTYSLPMVYGVSERAGLPGDADEKRKIQARQLKGYMLFFEQLLKDYLVQLNHLRDLFSFDDIQERTLFTAPLAHIDGEGNLIEEINGLVGLLIDHQDRGNNPELILKDFSEVLRRIVETPAMFRKRRNIFLDHMLARFGEDMSEYEKICRWLVPYKVDQRLIGDKTAVLKNGEYYRISTKRGLGYNYSSAEYCNSPNVSGTERRVSRLLGFRNADRHDLAPVNIITEPLMTTNDKNKEDQKKNAKGVPLNIIKILDPADNKTVLLTSVEVQEGCCTQSLITAILENVDIRRHFNFRDETSLRNRKSAGPVGKYWFELWDGPDPETAVLLANGERFTKQEDRERNYKRLQQVIAEINNNEGLHLIEHILLRPKLDTLFNEAGDPVDPLLLDICLDQCDLGKGIDPNVQAPPYRTKVTRVPAKECFDKMPWVLEYINKKAGVDHSFLFQETFTDDKEPVKMKFRRYELMAQRIQDLRMAGSERDNYTVVNNGNEDITKLKYGFIISSEEGVKLAQSLYEFSKTEVEKEILQLLTWFGFEMDWYCQQDPCDNNEDPYSFRATAVLPCWPKRLRDKTFRNLVEKTIATQAPAHVHINVKWVDVYEMQRFEKVYYEWLEEMYKNEMPSYEKVNPLIDTMQTLKACGSCDDDCS